MQIDRRRARRGERLAGLQQGLVAGAVLQRQGDAVGGGDADQRRAAHQHGTCLLYTSDAADERSSVDLGGRRIIKKKKKRYRSDHATCVKQSK